SLAGPGTNPAADLITDTSGPAPGASAGESNSPAFWIQTYVDADHGPVDFPFHLRATDLVGNTVEFAAPLIFVPLPTVEAALALDSLTAHYGPTSQSPGAGLAPGRRQTIELGGQ